MQYCKVSETFSGKTLFIKQYISILNLHILYYGAYDVLPERVRNNQC